MSQTEKKSRTTRQQYEIYLEELRISTNLSGKIILMPVSQTSSKIHEKLNESGGPIKSIQEWKKVRNKYFESTVFFNILVWLQTFTDWKSQTKARKVKLSNKETENKSKPPKPLTDLENTLLDIIGRVVEGMSGVPKVGIGIYTWYYIMYDHIANYLNFPVEQSPRKTAARRTYNSHGESPGY